MQQSVKKQYTELVRDEELDEELNCPVCEDDDVVGLADGFECVQCGCLWKVIGLE